MKLAALAAFAASPLVFFENSMNQKRQVPDAFFLVQRGKGVAAADSSLRSE
jgi:hypothetical protein